MFNEQGEFLGEFTEAAEGVLKKTKTTVSSWFEIGIIFGIIGLFIAPFWTILAIVAILLFKLVFTALKFILKCVWWLAKLLFKLVFKVLKFTFKCLWWIVRLPFCLLLWHELPSF
ncbi:MAG: hypothetical protein IJX08_07430 [Clostridia bacterium]|nr:hypothetical protein [Clostridia bacterium]